MNIYLDTSTLFKLYHREADSDEIENVFKGKSITSVFISEITKVEFSSAVWKKVRTKDISDSIAQQLNSAFVSDYGKYTFVQIDNVVIEEANRLVIKYGSIGLRTLDSIQLATALLLKSRIDLSITSDLLLKKIMKEEGLKTI